jgi:GNAT superfamily N-acetyltransferase
VSAASPGLLVRDARESDVPVLLEMFSEFATYVKLTHELCASEQGLRHGLFAERPAAQALIAELDACCVGYALSFQTFSSFLTSSGVWLEDLYVRAPYRGGGVGRALLSTLAARVRDGGGERLEWAVLQWNKSALGFYRSLGALGMEDLIIHRLDGQPLSDLADGAR